jgi:hypothetical protein
MFKARGVSTLPQGKVENRLGHGGLSTWRCGIATTFGGVSGGWPVRAFLSVIAGMSAVGNGEL